MKTITPKQETGKAINATSSREFESRSEARRFFSIVKRRLQDVNHWDHLAGGLSAEFSLLTPEGKPTEREPNKGDYLRIDIPGPGTNSGDGYDWVVVEEIDSNETEDQEIYSFRVRPAENPVAASKDTAHFYSPESTSTFMVMRENNSVSAEIRDRNIKPNTDAEKPLDQLRDTVVGTAGMISFSKIQWQNLTDGLIGA
jgi:hypothetical protein